MRTGEGRQTYLALACDLEDTLHIVFRQGPYSDDSPHFPARAWNALSYQRKPQCSGWERARVLVVPPDSGYAAFYHKLSVDRRGRLYISYSYRGGEPAKLYYGELPGWYHYPAMLTSGDGGKSWELAETAHFRAGIVSAKEECHPGPGAAGR